MNLASLYTPPNIESAARQELEPVETGKSPFIEPVKNEFSSAPYSLAKQSNGGPMMGGTRSFKI